jgi:hypothetical protein
MVERSLALCAPADVPEKSCAARRWRSQEIAEFS